MIEYRTGNVLDQEAEALVNTVNCVGVMGRGIALQFKKAFPENCDAYRAACGRNQVQPGRVFVFERSQLTNPKYIINFPTKRHWRSRSRIEDIESGLASLVREIGSRRIRSVAVPPLGSGLGGLDWANQVRPRIDSALGDLDDVQIVVFEPSGVPESVVRTETAPDMTAGRAALVVLVRHYLQGLLDPFVSLLEVHKLLYFMQEAGQPLRLRFSKAPYGPYAENLRHVLHAVEGYFLEGYRAGGDEPDKRLELVPGAVEEARKALQDDERTMDRFKRVAELVEGFESPFGLELLSTVHWVATREGARNPESIVAGTYSWSERKKRFTPRQIHLAYRLLSEKGWIDCRP